MRVKRKREVSRSVDETRDEARREDDGEKMTAAAFFGRHGGARDGDARRTCLCPLSLWYPFLRFFLNASFFASLKCSSTTACTAAPGTDGLPMTVRSAVPNIITSDNTTGSFTLASPSFSTTIKSSGTTLNCCAPTLTTPKISAGGFAWSAADENGRAVQIGAADARAPAREEDEARASARACASATGARAPARVPRAARHAASNPDLRIDPNFPRTPTVSLARPGGALVSACGRGVAPSLSGFDAVERARSEQTVCQSTSRFDSASSLILRQENRRRPPRDAASENDDAADGRAAHTRARRSCASREQARFSACPRPRQGRPRRRRTRTRRSRHQRPTARDLAAAASLFGRRRFLTRAVGGRRWGSRGGDRG